MFDDPPFDPAAPLTSLPAWWLEVICSCGRMTQLPMRLLIERHGPHAGAPALVARMRCQQCRSPPASAEWINNPQGGAFGSDYPPSQRVPVVARTARANRGRLGPRRPHERVLGLALDSVTARNASGFFRHAGYGRPE